MSIIKKLPPDIINKIAAGEVVERPASVIKELVENSIDAGATEIRVEIKNGGKDYICIQDNGVGMTQEDAQLAIEQHATSKIKSLDDLFSIHSFGFRGEALASISSVADFSLITKKEGELEGICVLCENNEKSFKPIAAKKGTKIEVKHLFKYVPARRQYLKKHTTEYNHVLQTFIQFALYHKKIAFILVHNEKTIYSFSQTDSQASRLKKIIGDPLTDSLMTVDFEENGISIKGLSTKPFKSLPSKSHQYLYINGRYIKSYVLTKAVMDSYNSLLPPNRHPIFVLNIEIDPKVVDVNVHPRKLEVRFSDERAVFRVMRHAIDQAIQKEDIHKPIEKAGTFSVPHYSHSQNSYGSPQSSRLTWKQSFQSGSLGQSKTQFSFAQSHISQKQSPNFSRQSSTIGRALEMSKHMLEEEQISQEHAELGDWILLGQIHNSYILVEDPNRGLLIIDQHAADERVNYEELKKKYDGGMLSSQKLLIPFTFDVSEVEVESILEKKDEFAKLGFDLEQFGDKTIIINGVPPIIHARSKNFEKIIEEMIHDFLKSGDVKSESIDYMLKTIACKTAIKFGDVLDVKEQIRILKDLKLIDNQIACAHGRPVILELTWKGINDLYERT